MHTLLMWGGIFTLPHLGRLDNMGTSWRYSLYHTKKDAYLVSRSMPEPYSTELIFESVGNGRGLVTFTAGDLSTIYVRIDDLASGVCINPSSLVEYLTRIASIVQYIISSEPHTIMVVPTEVNHRSNHKDIDYAVGMDHINAFPIELWEFSAYKPTETVAKTNTPIYQW